MSCTYINEQTKKQKKELPQFQSYFESLPRTFPYRREFWIFPPSLPVVFRKLLSGPTRCSYAVAKKKKRRKLEDTCMYVSILCSARTKSGSCTLDPTAPTPMVEFTQLLSYPRYLHRSCWRLHVVSLQQQLKETKKREREREKKRKSQKYSTIRFRPRNRFFFSPSPPLPLLRFAYRSPFIFLLGLSVPSFFSSSFSFSPPSSSSPCPSFRFFVPLNTPLACTLPSTGNTFTA